MSALDRIHRFNTKLTSTVTVTAGLIYNGCAVIAGLFVIWLAWKLPGSTFYGFSLDGWWQYAPYVITAAAAYGIWDGIARIVALTRSPPAPPPTTPDTW